MLKKFINYLKNNQIDCHADKSARNGRVCHYGVFALCRTKQFAFTLAETLIVMGIIGVVAALTLPNLNSSTGDKEKVVKLQKIYSNLQDAFGRAEAVYGPISEWCTGLSNENCESRAFERLTEFMKYSKKCTVTDCAAVFDKGSGSGGTDDVTAKHNIILADGSTVGIKKSNAISNQPLPYYLILRVDIDGLNKGPNTACKDYFSFRYDAHENTLTYDKMELSINQIKSSSSHCATWVIRNGNMDYLKVGNDGKCPDNKTVLDWTTNTTCK